MQRLNSLVVYPMIAVFWLIMWGILLRTELRPQGASLHEVPIGHVAKLFFREKQASDLVFLGEGARVGTLQITPSTPSENRCVLDFAGALQMRMLDGSREHIRWNGSLSMNDAFAPQMLGLNIMTGPTRDGFDLEITVDPVERVASYVSKTQGRVTDEQTFSLDRVGLTKLATNLGIDPGILQAATLSQGSAPHLTARQSSLQVHNEKVETYLVTVEMNGQTMIEAQISQLGVVLEVKTALGWTLESQ